VEQLTGHSHNLYPQVKIMNPVELKRYQAELLEMRPQLRDEIEHLINLLPEELIPPGDDWQEPSESFDVELETERTEELLYRQVTAALKRIEEGTFGRCQECGATIPQERLKAVPYAAYCIVCERRREQSV
jgi:DnaK suppressor protein